MTRFIPALSFHFLTHWFDLCCTIVGLGKRYRRKIIQVLDISQNEKHILDAGCGTGSLAIELKKALPTINLHAIDADPEALKIAHAKADSTDIRFQQAFIQELPFPDNTLDVVYSSLVFHHLPRQTKMEAMKEINRVLKKKGRFLLVDFGKPKNMLGTIFSLMSLMLEEGKDNYQGLLPQMLKDAGFRKTVDKATYRLSISFLEATK